MATNGRVTLSSSFGTNPPVLYLTDRNQAFVVGTDSLVTSGILDAQSAAHRLPTIDTRDLPGRYGRSGPFLGHKRCELGLCGREMALSTCPKIPAVPVAPAPASLRALTRLTVPGGPS